VAVVIEAWKINQKFVTLKFNMGITGKLYKRLFEGKPVAGSSKSVAGSRQSVVGSGKSAVTGGLWSVVRGLSLLMTIGILLSAFSMHPYYMSVTEFEYKSAEKEVQVSCKIFTDDLEETLKGTLNRKVDIMNVSTKKENEQLLNAYLQQHLKLYLDGKAVALEMIGFEQEGEAVWVYLVTKNTGAFKTARVFNDLLYSYKQEQINIIHFKNSNQRKSHRLNYPDKDVTMSW
jgi:hypothetical protein